MNDGLTFPALWGRSGKGLAKRALQITNDGK
jgi:hypothetical protein